VESTELAVEPAICTRGLGRNNKAGSSSALDNGTSAEGSIHGDDASSDEPGGLGGAGSSIYLIVAKLFHNSLHAVEPQRK
jgi:hypothetical protein